MAPDAEMMIGVLTVPAARLVVLTLTVRVSLDATATVPDVGLMLTHAAPSDAVQVSVPVPLLLIVTV